MTWPSRDDWTYRHFAARREGCRSSRKQSIITVMNDTEIKTPSAESLEWRLDSMHTKQRLLYPRLYFRSEVHGVRPQRSDEWIVPYPCISSQKTIHEQRHRVGTRCLTLTERCRIGPITRQDTEPNLFPTTYANLSSFTMSKIGYERKDYKRDEIGSRRCTHESNRSAN